MHTPSLKIYKSSAGSGKTFALVLEYLTVLLTEPKSFREILAITFTNKATEEMKQRIVHSLGKLAYEDLQTLEKDPLYKLLKEKLVNIDSPASNEISKRSHQSLSLILHDYSNFSVSTIESFFQRVIRAFARELNLPLGYDIQTEQKLVLDQIVRDVLLDAGESQAITRLFQGFIASNLDENKSWNIEIPVKNLGYELFSEAFQRRMMDHTTNQQIIEDVISFGEEIKRIKFGFERQMKAWAQEAIQIMDTFQLGVRDFAYGKSGPAGYFSKVSEASGPDDYLPGKRAIDVAHGQGAWYTKSSKRKADIQAALDAGLEAIMQQLIAHVDTSYTNYRSSVAVFRTLYSFGLLNDLTKKLNVYRKEQNEMIISDTSFLLNSIISDPDQLPGALTPFIYEKVGVRYQYYLLDEFQDTSDMQWDNLFPLVLEALAKGDVHTRVGIMGDVKQSIYRWRNGNMWLLMKDIEEQVYKATGQRAEVVPLDNNWRTAKEIVEFNNIFFKLAADLLGAVFGEDASVFHTAYSHVIQIAQKTEQPGYASIKAFPDRKGKDPEDVPSWKELAMEECVNLIKDLFTIGHKGKDIALLVRTNPDGIKLAEHLQAHRIKVVSAESLLINKHPHVRFMSAFFTFLLRPEDEIAKVSLQYYFALLSDTHEINHLLFTDDFQTFWALVKQHQQGLQTLPIYECAEHIRQLFPFLRETNAYLQGFMDTIWEFSNKFDASLSGFLEWWEEKKHKRAIATNEEPDAVRIMTIHKSKGLEFPIVILPLADWELEPKTNSIMWVEAAQHEMFQPFQYLPIHASSKLAHTHFADAYQEERMLCYLDNLNLLYVAFTRSKFQLHVFTKEVSPSKAKLNSISSLLAHTLNEEIFQGQWGEAPLHFETGYLDDEVISHDKEKERIEIELGTKPMAIPTQTIQGAGWSREIRIKYSANRYLPADWLSRYDKIAQGELLHEALAQIKYENEVEQAAKKMHILGYISSEKVQPLKEQLHRVISPPRVNAWYQPHWDVRNEREIITAEGYVLRPDRIMLTNDRAWVIDYKTGQARSKDEYQVRRYIQALRDMNYAEVKGFLYYLSSGEIKEVFSD